MATSGSWDFSMTAAQIINAAYEDSGLVMPGATVPSAHVTLALNRLNMIAKKSQSRSGGFGGMPVFARQRITMLLAKGQQAYTIGPAATDSRSSTLLGRTTVLSNYASGTSLAVSAITDTTSYPGTTISMTTADFIGVQLNDGTIGWTTLNGTPVSSPVTLTAGLSSAAAAGNYIWWFTARAQRFPYLEAAVLRDSSFNDVPLRIYTDVQQYELDDVSKFTQATPNAILVEPLRTNTRIICNSQPTDVTKTLVMTVLYPAEDYDASSDDIALPQEWYLYLKWELQKQLSVTIGKAWTPLMQDCYNDAKAAAANLNPETSVDYFECNA